VITSRPAWNGYLKLSFVSCPIALYPATSGADRLPFRQVNRRTGHRLRHKLVDSVTGEEVTSSYTARGYETATNKFLLVEDRDIEQARSERRPAPSVEPAVHFAPLRRESPPTAPTAPDEMQEDEGRARGDEEEQEEITRIPRPQNTRIIEIERFIPVGQVESSFFDKPYYIAPRGDISQEAFAVIRDAMAREKVVGLARIVLASRERPFLVEPMGRGLRGITLRFAQDLRPEHEFFEGIPSIKLPDEMMKLAQHIIRTKSGQFDAAMLEDRYRSALVRILRKKQGSRAASAPSTTPSRENVINLMDALRRSIAAQSKRKKPPAAGRASGKRRTRESARAARRSP